MLLIVVGYVHRLSHTDKSVVRISYVEQRESMMSGMFHTMLANQYVDFFHIVRGLVIWLQSP